jgi:hypothetical protein
MNGLYFESVIKDRQRDVSKYVEINRIHRQRRDSDTNLQEYTLQGESRLRLWMMRVGKRLRGVLAFNNKGSVKV